MRLTHNDLGTVSDVIVVGAGAAGLLTALSLRQSGYSVVLVDSSGIAQEQSRHSHGYLHRGHIYRAPKLALVEDLNQGADCWRSLLSAAGVSPVGESSIVSFTNRYEGLRAARRWQACGLVVDPVDAPAYATRGRLRVHYRTPEWTVDFTDWYAFACRELLNDVVFIRGHAMALEAEGRQIRGVRVRCGDSTVELRASTYIVVAGVGSIELVSSVVALRGRGVNRTSFMLVLEGDLPPRTSLIVADDGGYGLFIVSRTQNGRSVWLVSNYLSFAHHLAGTIGATLWLRATVKLLNSLTNALETDFRWGFYSAPKGELRSDPRHLSEHSIESYGFSNLIVGAPSKLTLVPLLAHQIRNRVQSQGDPRISGGPLELAISMPVPLDETWRQCSMLPGHLLRRFSRDAHWDIDDAYDWSGLHDE